MRLRHPRRLALAALLVLGAVAAVLLIRARNRSDIPIAAHHRTGRLSARPHPPGQPAPGPGLHPLGFTRARGDAFLYVPSQVVADRPNGLILYLHGHSGQAESGIKRMLPDADRLGVLVVAATSQGPTWDVVWRKFKHFGPDVAFVDAVLAQVFDRFDVDPKRVVVLGYSDGATYALALGMGNGDLFSRVVAMAPEYLSPAVRPTGKPPLFIAHGRKDDQHPIEKTSRPVVEQLKAAGYQVDYQEHDGGHGLEPALMARALDGM